MLNTEISKAVDLHWNACWPTNKLNPLIIVDLVTYLFYLKQLDTHEAGMHGRVDQTFFSEQEEELKWSFFSRLDADKMQKLFVKDGGVIEWVDGYAKSNHPFSKLLSTPLLMVPTPKLLAHAVAIVNIMSEYDLPSQSLIFNYLIRKTATIDNRLINIPENIIQLMVSLLNQKRDDVVLDPLAGTGNSLIQVSKYVRSDSGEGNANDIHKIFTGIEPDPVLYRIAALNLFLSGAQNALLKTSGEYKDGESKPTMVVGNLLFQSIPVDGSTEMVTNEQLFNFIEKSLQAGGRAAVLLSNTQNNIHKTLIDKHTLEAVVSLPKELLTNYDQVKVNLLFFTKAFPKAHPPVWFYEVTATDLPPNGSGTGESLPYTQLLHQWQNLEQQRKYEPTEKSFFVPVAQIKKYNYDLNIARYQYVIERSKEEIPKESLKKKTGIVVIPPPKSAQVAPLGTSTLQRIGTPSQVITNLDDPSIKRKRNTTVITGLVVTFLLGAAAIYFTTFNSTGNSNKTPGETMVRKADVVEPELTEQSQAETKEQSGTVSNTKKTLPQKSGSKKVAGPSTSTVQVAPEQKQQKEKVLRKTTVQSIEEKEQVASQNAAGEGEVKGLYKIIDKAYFHNSPDESTKREAFVIHWNNSYVTIKALEEKNDFVYTVFKNHLGQTSKGWLRKKDLRPLDE